MQLKGNLSTLGSRAKAQAPIVAQVVLNASAAEIVSDAQARWPVKTGRSRSGLVARPTRRNGKPAVEIRDGSGYAPRINLTGFRGKPWILWIIRPAIDATPKVAKALGKQLVAKLSGSRHG